MTTELERKFFETFGIEPMLKGYSQEEDNWQGLPTYSGEIKYFNSFEEMKKAGFHSIYDNEKNEEDFKEYPTITDTHYLELIRLGLNYDFVIRSKSVEELKEKLLALLIYNEAEFKHQVQELFKGE